VQTYRRSPPVRRGHASERVLRAHRCRAALAIAEHLTDIVDLVPVRSLKFATCISSGAVPPALGAEKELQLRGTDVAAAADDRDLAPGEP
jgi:hypothetical protein